MQLIRIFNKNMAKVTYKSKQLTIVFARSLEHLGYNELRAKRAKKEMKFSV